MKKILQLILLLVVMTACSQEEPILMVDSSPESTGVPRVHQVSQKRALERMYKYFSSVKPGTRAESTDIDNVYPLTVNVEEPVEVIVDSTGNNVADTIAVGDKHESEIAYAYVVNFKEDGGFVILGALEEMPEIIAFTEDGNLPTPGVANTNKPFNPMVEDYLNDLKLYAEITISTSTLDNEDNPILSVTYSETKSTYVNGETGLCPVQWHQGNPYNKLFPLVNSTDRMPAGCLTVAVAQLMACHKYPSSYGNFDFDWNAMANNGSILDHFVNSEDMIAHLMWQLSLPENLDVQYYASVNQTAAFTNRVAPTLANFGYSSNGIEISFNQEIVADELYANRPVIFSGINNLNNKEGHAWLVHGLLIETREKTTRYKDGREFTKTITDYKFNCNWGWDPSSPEGKNCNGWYSAFNFNPKEKNGEKAGKYINLKIIYNIHP